MVTDLSKIGINLQNTSSYNKQQVHNKMFYNNNDVDK